MEHHICQLADVCLPHLVLHALDGEGPEALRHAVFSVHGCLWQPADSSAVHLELWEHGSGLRAVCQEEQPVPLTFIEGLEVIMNGYRIYLTLTWLWFFLSLYSWLEFQPWCVPASPRLQFHCTFIHMHMFFRLESKDAIIFHASVKLFYKVTVYLT